MPDLNFEGARQISLSFEGAPSTPLSFGGTTTIAGSYEPLTDKPSIEGVTLRGNRLLSEFGDEPLSNVEIKAVFDRVFRKD